MVDTHVLIWALEDNDRLGPAARALIERAVQGEGVHVSAITPWEIAMLAHRGRLVLGREVGAWIDAALALPNIRLAPIAPEIAVDSVRLPGEPPKDPADRLIIATARRLALPLLTADRLILGYGQAGHVGAIDASA